MSQLQLDNTYNNLIGKESKIDTQFIYLSKKIMCPVKKFSGYILAACAKRYSKKIMLLLG